MPDKKVKEEDESSLVLKEFLKKKPDEGEDLLSLVLETGRITRSAASRSLRIPEDVVTSWYDKLEEAGWIKPIDRDLDDPMIELSDNALKKLRSLERDFFEKVEEQEEAAIKEEEAKTDAKSLAATGQVARPKYKAFTLIDALVFSSTLLAIVMFKKFSEDTSEVMFLLFGMLLILFSVIIYQRKIKQSKARFMVMSLWGGLSSTLKAFKVHKLHVLAFVFVVGVIYLVGRFLLVRKLIYLVGAVICFSLIPFIYTRKGNKKVLARLYLGIMLIIYALLLLFGLTSFTEYFTAKIRAFDVLTGISLLIYLKIRESYFRLDALARLVRKKKEEKPKSI